MMDFLYHYSENVYSQHGEDGINKTLFDYLNIKEGLATRYPTNEDK